MLRITKKNNNYNATIAFALTFIILKLASFDGFYVVLINTFYIWWIVSIGLILAFSTEILLTKRNFFDTIKTRLNQKKQSKQTKNKGNHNEKTIIEQKEHEEDQQLLPNSA